MSALGGGLRVLAGEGPAAARDRLLDRMEEWRRRRTFAAGGAPIAAGVLNVLATPPARRLGGLQVQFLGRLELEAERRAYALLHPDDGGYRLERRHGSRRSALALAGPSIASPVAMHDPAFEAAVLRAVEASGATAVHVEGMAGLPPASVLGLARRGLRVILSLHDFALFCPRHDLLEQPVGAFCGYCTDWHRCHACLGRDWDVGPEFQSRYREAGAELLAAASAVIHPSSYLRAKVLELVPGLDPAVHRVIAPAGPARSERALADHRAGGRRVAFVGAVQVRKGALVFEDVVRRLGGDALRWRVFGGGDPPLLRRLRRLPHLSVRGYYRAGALPRLLRAHRIDVALLLSVIPESYGLTLDECQDAGVPIITFDHGAMADRVRASGGGLLVPPEAGAAGVAATLRDVLSGRRSFPATHGARVGNAASAHLALYRELGVL